MVIIVVCSNVAITSPLQLEKAAAMKKDIDRHKDLCDDYDYVHMFGE